MIEVLKFGINGLKNEILYKIDSHFNQNLSKPTLVNLTITHRCNFRCKQCDYWKTSRNELTLDQLKSMFSNLRRWLGPFYLSICGGEPFVREDIIDFITFSSRLGIVTEVITNGSMVDKELAEKISASGLKKITFSLDGAKPKTHDALRNFEGSFDRVIEAIKLLRNMSKTLNISLNTTIMDDNLEELEDVVGVAIKHDLNGVFFRGLMCNDLQNSHNEFYEKSPLWTKDKDKLCKAVDNLITLKRSGYPVSNTIKHLQFLKGYLENPSVHPKNVTCFAQMRYFNINSDGGVRVCEHYVGNLLELSPKKIWVSHQAKELRKQKMKCKRPCMLKNPGDIGESLKDKFHVFHRSFRNNLKISLFRN